MCLRPKASAEVRMSTGNEPIISDLFHFGPCCLLEFITTYFLAESLFFPNIPGQCIAHRPSVVLRHPSVSCACQENSSCAFRDAIIIFFIYVYNLYSPSPVVIFFLGNEGVSSVQCWYSYQKQKPPTHYLWEIDLFQYN